MFGIRFGSAGHFVEDEGCNAVGYLLWRPPGSVHAYNLRVAKQFSENFQASLSILNVLDNQYREDASQTGYPFFFSFIGADPRGRRFYVTLDYKF